MFRLLRFRILFAVALILFAMSAAHFALHTTQGLQGGLHDPQLAAADYRAPIVDVETVLFDPGPLSMEDRIRLAVAIDAMRRDLDARGGTNLAKYSARELGTLATMSRGLGDLQGADLERIRQNWMRIRSNTFDDASWFRFSESDPVVPREEAAVELSDEDRAVLAGLKTSLDRVEDTIRRGERDCEQLGEPAEGASFEERRALGNAWSAWGSGWRDDVQRIQDGLPRAPQANAPAAVRFAHADAVRAIAALRSVPTSGGGMVPYRRDWARRFDEVHRLVRCSRDWMARAERGPGV